MTDGIIKGTGNSRYLRSVANILALYPTYEAFAQALAAGTLPIDLNGINPAGWNTAGTALDKASLLSDTTAKLYGKTSTATVNDVLAAIKTYVDSSITTTKGELAKAMVFSYTGSGSGNARISVPSDFKPKFSFVSSNKYYSTSESWYFSCALNILRPSETTAGARFYHSQNGNTASEGLNVNESYYSKYSNYVEIESMNSEGITYLCVLIG